MKLRQSAMLPAATSSTLSPSAPGDAFPILDLRKILGLSLLSGAVWLAIISFGAVGTWIGVVITGVLLIGCLAILGKGEIVESLAVLMYLAMVQPALRRFVSPLPYLTLEYFFIFWAIISLGKYKGKRLQAAAIFYLLYLVLEIFGVFGARNPENARSILLSSLTVGFALLLVNKLHLKKEDIYKLFTAIIIGAANLVVIIGYGYATSSIDWGRQSNFAASGGMGPVQISMLLAIGVVIFLLLADRVNFTRRMIYIILAAGISLVMVLTFSRNGLYLTIIALAAYYLLFSKFSLRTVVTIFLLSIAGIYLFNFASQVAGSAFKARYSNLNPAGRDILVTYGWDIFRNNFVWGVGTSNYYHVIAQAEYLGSSSGSHNELIRAAAEHGIVGLSTWVFFAISCFLLGFSQAKGKARALRMTLLIVFFAYLAVNGLKLLMQPLILMIALSVDEF